MKQTKVTDWYKELVVDIRSILLSVNKNIVMGKWSIGDRILKDHLRFKKAQYGDKTIEKLAKDLSVSSSDLWRCLQFRKKYASLDSEKELLELSWDKIKGLLPNDSRQVASIPSEVKVNQIEEEDELEDLKPVNLPVQPDWRRFTTVWNFKDKGIIEGLSNLPSQILFNLFYYYLEKEDVILDPFSGEGLTQDAINWYNKEYGMKIKGLNYDLNPRRDFIKKNDIRNGFPKEVKDINLVFLDPPYWKMIDYGKNSLDKLSLNEFYKEMRELANNCHKCLKKGGKVAFIIMPVKDKGEFIDLGFECYHIFKEFFKPIQRFCVPVMRQPYPLKKGEFMATLRDLFIMEKQ